MRTRTYHATRCWHAGQLVHWRHSEAAFWRATAESIQVRWTDGWLGGYAGGIESERVGGFGWVVLYTAETNISIMIFSPSISCHCHHNHHCHHKFHHRHVHHHRYHYHHFHDMAFIHQYRQGSEDDSLIQFPLARLRAYASGIPQIGCMCLGLRISTHLILTYSAPIELWVPDFDPRTTSIQETVCPVDVLPRWSFCQFSSFRVKHPVGCRVK